MGWATKQQIMEVLKEKDRGGGEMTYVIRNILVASYYRWKIPNLSTSTVRKQLEKLEFRGLVERVPSSYSRQICWSLTELGRAWDGLL